MVGAVQFRTDDAELRRRQAELRAVLVGVALLVAGCAGSIIVGLSLWLSFFLGLSGYVLLGIGSGLAAPLEAARVADENRRIAQGDHFAGQPALALGMLAFLRIPFSLLWSCENPEACRLQRQSFWTTMLGSLLLMTSVGLSIADRFPMLFRGTLVLGVSLVVYSAVLGGKIEAYWQAEVKERERARAAQASHTP